MREKLKHEIAKRIVKQGELNVLIQNLGVINELDSETLDYLLGLRKELEIEIEKIREELKNWK